MGEKHDMEKAEKEKKEDERILAINLDSCPPALRTYYEILHHGILEKAAARRKNEQGPGTLHCNIIVSLYVCCLSVLWTLFVASNIIVSLYVCCLSVLWTLFVASNIIVSL